MKIARIMIKIILKIEKGWLKNIFLYIVFMAVPSITGVNLIFVHKDEIGWRQAEINTTWDPIDWFDFVQYINIIYTYNIFLCKIQLLYIRKRKL